MVLFIFTPVFPNTGLCEVCERQRSGGSGARSSEPHCLSGDPGSATDRSWDFGGVLFSRSVSSPIETGQTLEINASKALDQSLVHSKHSGTVLAVIVMSFESLSGPMTR